MVINIHIKLQRYNNYGKPKKKNHESGSFCCFIHLKDCKFVL